jgi:hypothetical protein
MDDQTRWTTITLIFAKSKFCPKQEIWSPYGSSIWGSLRTGFSLDNQGICTERVLIICKTTEKLVASRLDLVRCFNYADFTRDLKRLFPVLPVKNQIMLVIICRACR